MSRVCSFDLEYAGERIALLGSDVFTKLSAQELVTLVSRNTGEAITGFTRSLTEDHQSIPYKLRTRKESFLSTCGDAVGHMASCNLMRGRPEFLVFCSPEIERAVSVHPHALRLFWGVQVPVTAQCGVFNLHGFTSSRTSPAVGVPPFFFSKRFDNALRLGAFVPDVLDAILRMCCEPTELALLVPTANAGIEDRNALKHALLSVSKFKDRDGTLLQRQDRGNAASASPFINSHSFVGDVGVSRLGFSCLSGLGVTILVYAGDALLATVTGTLSMLENNLLCATSAMALSSPRLEYPPSYTVRTVCAHSIIHRPKIALLHPLHVQFSEQTLRRENCILPVYFMLRHGDDALKPNEAISFAIDPTTLISQINDNDDDTGIRLRHTHQPTIPNRPPTLLANLPTTHANRPPTNHEPTTNRPPTNH